MPLLAHVGLLVVALGLVLPLARPTVPTPDEGAYGIQAELVAGGQWDYRPPLAELDPDGTWFPISRADAIDGRWYPYIKHPLVPAAMARLIVWFGRDAGVGLFSLAGTVAAAVAAWFLAKELDPRRSRAAFWLTATSPLLVDGFMAGAHTWAAACAGAAACAAVRIGRRGPTPGASAVLALALCGGVLVRSEGVLFAGALLLAVALVRWRRSGLGPSISAVAVPGLAVATALWLERRWVARIVDSGAPSDLVARVGPDGSGGTVGGTYLLDRLQGIWHSTVEGTAAGPLTVRLLLPVALALVVAAVVRGSRDRVAPELAIGGLAALAVLVWVVHPTALVRGFLPASPVIVLGVVVALAARRWRDGEAVLLGTAALFTLAVYATQYADGGNFQWGGRFLAPLVVPLAVVAAGGVQRLVAGRAAPQRRLLVGSLVALAVLVSVCGVAALGTGRQLESELYAQIAASASPVNVTTSDLLPRTMWREDMGWLRAQPDDLDRLLEEVRAAGVESVTVVAAPEDVAASSARWPVAEDRGQVGTTSIRITVLRQ